MGREIRGRGLFSIRRRLRRGGGGGGLRGCCRLFGGGC